MEENINEIPTHYNPADTEDKWYKFWEDNGYFGVSADSGKKPFSIVIPPPNVTGILHMGHALNDTIQDILIRQQRMKGKSSLWMPGTDHAGIATQNVVEKMLMKEGLRRQDLGREKFLERVWQWKEQYGSTIIKQLRKLGASCDWTRARFTMDEGYSRAVTEVFIRLYEKGLVYRGEYIINWCPRCQTALADEEAPHHELDAHLYYLKYPLKDDPSRSVTVATTRPETMLGDTAVAVNPNDRRYKKLVGKTLLLPLAGREIKIIADSEVDAGFGTGAVKVTPAHDPNDYRMGRKHGLQFINVMHPDGRMNDLAGEYSGMDRFEAREVVLEDMKEKGLLEKIEPHKLSAGHCYRCHTIIEPYLSRQWFVKMKPLSLPAIEAVKKGRIKFYPKRWTKVYLNWMENIQDWCISRQIWWGHRLPVYYCDSCLRRQEQSTADSPSRADRDSGRKNNEEEGVIVSGTKPEKCPVCGNAQLRQDEDVLDTWFSSWLWPFATFGWPFGQGKEEKKKKKELAYFYPTDTLTTASEIIFFWVARMIMAGFEFMGDIPFRDVYIHGTVRDKDGRKMSKSLGNSIDPLEIISQYGTDALRFSLIAITAQGQDVYLSRERFEQGRNFANKIWNASRLVMMNLEPGTGAVEASAVSSEKDLSAVNRWILSRLSVTLKKTDASLSAFRFNEAANLLYSFFWKEYCDWYLEIIKLDMKDRQNQSVMLRVLENFLAALHPFMPFITEEIWQKLPHVGDSVMTRAWPAHKDLRQDRKAETFMEDIFAVIAAVRNIRQELDIPPQKEVPAVIAASSKAQAEALKPLSAVIRRLARISVLGIEKGYNHKPSSVAAVAGGMHVSVLLVGIVDIAAQREKLRVKIDNTSGAIRGKEAMLAKPGFADKAPGEIVDKEKDRLRELKETLERYRGIYEELRK